jgi:hypothetical protein
MTSRRKATLCSRRVVVIANVRPHLPGLDEINTEIDR